jgi:16S rRNA (uracil1498-N3)-methyltransferase
MTRIYQQVPLQIQQSLALDEKASHHLAKVLRAQVGESLILFNGEGGEYSAKITQITKKAVTVLITAFTLREAESPIHIHLAQGIARGEKMDFIVQKAVELGASQIIPLTTERSTVRLNAEREEKRLSHWQAVVISACEQSGRNHLPEVTAPQSLNEWLPQVKADLCFVLSPHVNTKLPDHPLPQNASIVLLIGSEGGLSNEEVHLAMQQGFLPLNLGPRVLRTETATLAALTMIQFQYGDL